MNLFATSPLWMLAVLAVVLVAAMIQDATQLRISNVLTGLVLALALAAMVVSGPTIDLWENFVVFAVVLGIGTLLFSRGMLGGGDVKLFAAVGLWSDLRTAIGLVSTILIAGGVLALVMVAYRMARGKGIRKRSEAGGIPYGVAIGIGTMLTAYMAVSMGSAVG